MPSSRDRALLIVELLVPEVRGLPMSDIADRLGIPRTATHRLYCLRSKQVVGRCAGVDLAGLQ